MSDECGYSVPYPEESICGVYQGGNKHMILVKPGVDVDTEDQASVQAAIDAGNARIVKRVAINIAAPSAVEATQQIACETPGTVTYNRTMEVTDPKTSAEHIDFWNAADAANGTSWAIAIVYNCAQNTQLVIENTVKFQGGLQSPGTDEEEEFFLYTGAWKSPTNPEKQAANPIFLTSLFTS